MKEIFEISLTEETKDALHGACMDNTMALDALAQKNYKAVKAILERQDGELKKVVAALLNK